MENFLKIGLIALGGYLAYDYIKKRKNNRVTTRPINPAINNSVSPELIEAGMEEEGEEGAAIAEMSEAAGADANGCLSGERWCASKGICMPSNAWYSECVGSSSIQARVAKRNVSKKSFSRADGWDSDIISGGM